MLYDVQILRLNLIQNITLVFLVVLNTKHYFQQFYCTFVSIPKHCYNIITTLISADTHLISVFFLFIGINNMNFSTRF